MPAKIKVAILCNFPVSPFGSQLGGLKDKEKRFTTWNYSLVNALKKNQNITLRVITRSNLIYHDKTIYDGNLAITFLAGNKFLNGISLFNYIKWRSNKIIDSIEPDIVHGIGTEHIWPYTAVSRKEKSVITIHGVMNEIVKKTKVKMFDRKRYFALLEKTTIKKSRNIIVISDHVEKFLAGKFNGKTYFINNPIDPIFMTASADPQNSKRILFVGDMSERKSLITLIESFSKIANHELMKDWRIIVAGPIAYNEQYSRILDIIKKNNLETRINFKGFLNPQQLLAEYCQAAMLVLTSLEETAPMCIAEAMAVGLPVVSPRISGIPQMVRENESAFLVDSGNQDGLNFNAR